jgi:FkbM family methyltransferase
MLAKEFYQDSEFLLCEPLPDRKEHLEKMSAQSDRVHFESVIVGDSVEPIWFDVSDDLDGSGVYGGQSGHTVELPQNTLDRLLASSSFEPPYLIKFDTHGFESPILKGATETLRMTDAIIMECYTHRVSPTAKLFWEMCDQLHEIGFRPIHISDLLARQFDSTLWQMDLFFVRSDHPVFDHDRYV